MAPKPSVYQAPKFLLPALATSHWPAHCLSFTGLGWRTWKPWDYLGVCPSKEGGGLCCNMSHGLFKGKAGRGGRLEMSVVRYGINTKLLIQLKASSWWNAGMGLYPWGRKEVTSRKGPQWLFRWPLGKSKLALLFPITLEVRLVFCCSYK